jgi:DNA mismatch endonuclease, patch repair protein
MRANRGTSRTEVRFRRALWAAGARGYRCKLKLPGRPDVAFLAIRWAVFVHGCFWHGCQKCRLPRPKANADFWRQKLERNAARDRAVEADLAAAGWKVITVWEHELRADLEGSAHRIAHQIARERGALRKRIGANR